MRLKPLKSLRQWSNRCGQVHTPLLKLPIAIGIFKQRLAPLTFDPVPTDWPKDDLQLCGVAGGEIDTQHPRIVIAKIEGFPVLIVHHEKSAKMASQCIQGG